MACYEYQQHIPSQDCYYQVILNPHPKTICDLEVETILHSLVFCDPARQVWDKWKDCLVNLRSNYLDFADIAMGFMAAGALHDLELFFVIAWSLWCSRNLKVFEAEVQTPDQV